MAGNEGFCLWDITPDVTQKHVVSIFRVEEQAKQETTMKQAESRAT
jgi:hypothetical protein